MQTSMHRRGLGAFALLAAIAAAPSGARAQAAAADGPEAGRAVFTRQCAACHATEPGQHKIGPSMAGVFGRPAAQATGFAYSPAMRDLNRTWDRAALDAYLADPRGDLPGGRMIYLGLRDPKQRADVIAYLATLR